MAWILILHYSLDNSFARGDDKNGSFCCVNVSTEEKTRSAASINKCRSTVRSSADWSLWDLLESADFVRWIESLTNRNKI